MKRAIRSAVGALVAAGACSAAFPVEAAQEWNLASRLADGVFHTVNLRMFAEEVEEATDGELTITIHSAASLFRHPEIKRAVQTGQAEMGTVQISSFANEDEFYNFDSLPFLATTYTETQLLWEAAAPIFEDKMRAEGIRVLWAEPWPPQAFYANKRLEALSDLEGVKFRTYSRIGSELAELMDAQPVLIVASEVPQAFSTGMAQAMVTSSAFGASVQAWDFVDVYNDVGAWLGLEETLVNEEAFQSLSPEHQEVVLEAAARAEVRGMAMSIEANTTAKEELASHGVVIESPSEEFMAQLREVAEPIIEDWAETVGPDGRAVLDRYYELRSRLQ